MEAAHEIPGLRFWDGYPTVRLLAADEDLHALLLERCLPGTPLRDLDEPKQAAVIAGLLRRLWRVPPAPHVFRPLSGMIDCWIDETLLDAANWPDAGLVREGIGLLRDLSRDDCAAVLLATDLHAGNVLRAQREPWLAIDPKPFLGDPAYDLTQHLLNCRGRLAADPDSVIARFSDLAGVDRKRVQLWTFARLAGGVGDWNRERVSLARSIGP
jgi:streptomycin 6-kinase